MDTRQLITVHSRARLGHLLHPGGALHIRPAVFSSSVAACGIEGRCTHDVILS